MLIERLPRQHEDARGHILDILVKTPIDGVTLISSRQGSIRGDHYHRETTQWLYLLSGKLLVYTCRDYPHGDLLQAQLSPGDFIETPPMEAHTVVAVTDAEFLVLTRGPRSGADYETDTYRLTESLVPYDSCQ